MKNTMKSSIFARRQFLRGAGGFSLALPCLSSLLPRGAHAQSPKKFVAITSPHGAVWVQDMCPALSTLTNRMDLYPGHNIGSGPLQRTIVGPNAKLSNILSAPSTALTDRLVSKINVLEGFDVAISLGHNSGSHLGNFVRNDQGPKDLLAIPTIDQLLAWSPTFYPNLNGIRERAIVTGEGGISWNYSSPSSRSGEIQRVQAEPDPARLFDRVFMGGVPTEQPGAPKRPPVVDKVLAEYKAMRNGNRRLSNADKQRLDDYMDRLAELQRVLTASAPVAASCADVRKPGAGGSVREHHGRINDVIAAAFLCGSSRIATNAISNLEALTDYRGDFHEAVAHSTWRAKEPMDIMIETKRRVFEWVFLDLVRKLDVDSGAGSSLLDDTLVQWTQESGPESHTNYSNPIVTAGNAGGYFKTGMFVDYRNVRPASAEGTGTVFGTPPKKYVGLLHNRWLSTALQAMGLNPGEYETATMKGYGDARVDSNYRNKVVPQVLTDRTAPVPLITA